MDRGKDLIRKLLLGTTLAFGLTACATAGAPGYYSGYGPAPAYAYGYGPADGYAYPYDYGYPAYGDFGLYYGGWGGGWGRDHGFHHRWDRNGFGHVGIGHVGGHHGGGHR